jgi:predicted PurR-regulated permease PerM
MTTRQPELWFFVVLFSIVLFFTWTVFVPFASVIILAGTFAFLFRPLYNRILPLVRYESLAALSIVVLVAFIIFLPLGIFGLRIFSEATTLYSSIRAQGTLDLGPTLNNLLNTQNFDAYAQQALTWLIQNLGSFFSDIAQILFLSFLSLLGLFYFLKDGPKLKEWILETVPLKMEDTQDLMHGVEAAVSSVFKGTLFVAIIDGFILGVGFYLFHIPDPSFWGTLAVLISIIPVIGAWLVAVPGIAYLVLTGHMTAAIGLAIWSVILINLVYSLISPQLIRRGFNMHPYVILLGILGGIASFGPIGFLIGPLIISLLFALLKVYKKMV